MYTFIQEGCIVFISTVALDIYFQINAVHLFHKKINSSTYFSIDIKKVEMKKS